MTDFELEIMLDEFLEKAHSLENRVSRIYEIVAVVSESVECYLRKYNMTLLGYTDTMNRTLFGYPIASMRCKMINGQLDLLEPAVCYNSPGCLPDGITTGDYVIKDGGLMHAYNVSESSGGYKAYYFTPIPGMKDVSDIVIDECIPVDDFGKNIDTSAIADYLSSIVVN